MKTQSEFPIRLYGQFKNHLAVRAATLLLCLVAVNGSAQTYTVLHNFTNGSACPTAALVLSGSALYGTTCGGTLFGGGITVFKMNTTGSNFMVLQSYLGNDGEVVEGGIMLLGETLYGTWVRGGWQWGAVFKINTDGSDYTILKLFTGDDGANPMGPLIAIGTTLFGTTLSGGYGTVFSINTDGSGFAVLKNFNALSGPLAPDSGLALSGSTLYGTSSGGGSYGRGTVFSINTDGSNLAVLKSFAGGTDGQNPMGGLVLSGSTLYGTTYCTNASYGTGGTVFKINTDGSGYTILKAFGGLYDAACPMGGLVLSGSTLYGTTRYGGKAYYGTVFKINTDGTGFAILKSFTQGDGANPFAGLVLSGTTLYGTTYQGGANNCGVVFSLSIAPPTVTTPPQSQTAELGSTVNFEPDVAGASVMTYQWFFNGNAITNCTNPVLCLSGVQASNTGTFTIVVTNLFGAVTSAPAMLNVIPPVERRPVPGVEVTGEGGSLLYVDYANTLNPVPDWSTFGSVDLTGMSQFYFDLTAPLPPQRFYRAWQTGTPSVVPSLNLNFVPAITLTGNIGDSLQLDYINQFGPTDAWVTLDTVTLTNTSQLYFDVSVIGQPARLYRIVPVP